MCLPDPHPWNHLTVVSTLPPGEKDITVQWAWVPLICGPILATPLLPVSPLTYILPGSLSHPHQGKSTKRVGEVFVQVEMTSSPLEGKLGMGRDSRGPWHIAGALSHGGTWSPLGGGEKRAGQGPGKCFVPTTEVPFLRGSLPLVVAPSAGGPVTQPRTGHSRLLHLLCPYPSDTQPAPSYCCSLMLLSSLDSPSPLPLTLLCSCGAGPCFTDLCVPKRETVWCVGNAPCRVV